MSNPQQAAEVAWYQVHGQHRARVQPDGSGVPYVIGDKDWNAANPRDREFVEPLMPQPWRIEP